MMEGGEFARKEPHGSQVYQLLCDGRTRRGVVVGREVRTIGANGGRCAALTHIYGYMAHHGRVVG